MTPPTETARYVADFAAARDALPGAGLPWLVRLRDSAIERFAAAGFPSPRDEAWKYTDLRRVLRKGYAPVPAGRAHPAADAAALGLDGPRHLLVFVDGRFDAGLSDLAGLPDGVRVTTLAAAVQHDAAGLEEHLGRVAAPNGSGLVALNTAFMNDGAVLQVADGVALEAPVQLVFLATAACADAVVHPRTLIVLGARSRAVVVESYAASGRFAYWTNAVTEIVAGPGARLHHSKLQQEGPGACHIGLVQARLMRDAAYSGFVLSTGARLARNEIRVRLDGEAADCRLDGGSLLRGRQHMDNTTEVEHAAPRGTSRQVYKGVVDGDARTVFQGRILVRPDAQRTDAHQLNRNLLLSPRAEADSKPELVIHADDVKCSHGATTGDLDRDALFYLRARGIDPASARALLIEAFIGDLIADVPLENVRARLGAALDSWLGRADAVKEAA